MSVGRRSMTGRVVSNKMQKTVIVEVVYRRRHPLYKKIVKKRRRFLAHDEQNTCQEGDMVQIIEARPLSRRKRWRVSQILQREE